MENVTWWLALGAGVLSFLSPCSLPLYPSYLSYITGISVAQLKAPDRSKEIRQLTLIHALCFIAGFSLVFYALGFTVSWLGQLFSAYKDLLRMIGAIIIIVMGLFLLGLFQPRFLLQEKRWQVSKRRVSYLTSFLIGIGFAAGWTPCLGPILAAVLAMTLTQPEMAFIYITCYTLGFALPFLLLAFFIGRMRWIVRYAERVMKCGGAVMIVLGILLYTDQMTQIIAWFTRLTGGFTGF